MMDINSKHFQVCKHFFEVGETMLYWSSILQHTLTGAVDTQHVLIKRKLKLMLSFHKYACRYVQANYGFWNFRKERSKKKMGFKQIHLMWGAWVLLLELLNVLKILFNGILGETSIYSMEKSKYLGQYQSHLAMEISIYILSWSKSL